MTRPTEVITAIVGNLVGAVLIIAGVFTDTTKITPEVAGAITLVISNMVWAITWFVARKQRDPNDPTGSAPDGKVT